MAMGIGVFAIGALAAFVAPPAGDNASSADLVSADGAALATTELSNVLLDQAPPGAKKERLNRSRGTKLLVAPGESGRSGPGKLMHFKVEVESAITSISTDEFAAEVEDRLMDHRSWGNKDGRALQRVSTGKADFRVTLAKPNTVDRLCYPRTTGGFVSCFEGGRAVINLQRWRHGAPDFPTLRQYRTYLINHEVGHGLAKGHWFCPAEGGAGKLMMQQTYTMADNCSPERFARPNGPKFKSTCTLSTQNRDGRLFIVGSVNQTPWRQRIELAHQDTLGEHELGTVQTTADGHFEVPIEPANLDPSVQSVSMTFSETRDLTGCAGQAPLAVGG
jgi:hypothetical protein